MMGGRGLPVRWRSGQGPGFTLVELMIVVAVLTILAGIGYPLYTKQVHKARRVDARNAVLAVAMAQERFFTRKGRYAASLGSLTIDPGLQGGRSEQGYYALTSVAGSTTFTITATATGKQAGDTDCKTFSMDQTGVKRSTGGGSNCW